MTEQGLLPTLSASDVAYLFLAWANKDGDLISNLKMQKLLYYAQAWHLVHFDQPLFNNSIEAWEFGPVVPSVYHEFKVFGSSPIEYSEKTDVESLFREDQLEFLKEFYGTFIKFTAHELVSMTHAEKPWIDAEKKGKSSPIDNKECIMPMKLA